jgi:hypothetical protein
VRIYEYDPETKGRVKSGSMVVCLTAKKSAKVIKKLRSCSWLFFIFEEWSFTNVPLGHTVNAAFYVELLKRLREHL